MLLPSCKSPSLSQTTSGKCKPVAMQSNDVLCPIPISFFEGTIVICGSEKRKLKKKTKPAGFAQNFKPK